MTRIDPGKLLGGHAAGILTEEERKALYAAALEHQDLFDALADEEALRELLADPAAKAQLLAALDGAPPRVVPFWRRTGVLGAAAGLLMASLAGLAYLRSPDKAAPALRRETEPVPAPKAVPAPLAEQAPAAPPRPRPPLEKAKEAPPPAQAVAPTAPPPPEPRRDLAPAGGAPVAVADAAREKALEFRRAEAQESLAKKAEAPKAAALVEVVASVAPAPEAKKAKRDQAAPAAALAPGVAGGVVGGVVGGVAPPRRVEWKAAAAFKPAWTLEPGGDGLTRLQVRGPEGASAVLLKRGAGGVEVVPLERAGSLEGMDHWRGQVRLVDGDVLDLYLLNAPTAEPARLPERGPVDGFRARIYPAARQE